MTETTNQTATGIHRPPAGFLLSLVIVLLTPLFLGVTGGDVGLARAAAIETIDSCRIRNQADIVAVAQMIAFGLAAPGSLSLSMADDISVSMTLRLRGNAVSCDRAAEHNRRALVKSQANAPVADHPGMAPEFPDVYDVPGDETPFFSEAAARVLAAESTARLQDPVIAPETASDHRYQHMWATAMAKEASVISATMQDLPPAERNNAAMWVAALDGTARHLINGETMPALTRGALDGITTPGLARLSRSRQPASVRENQKQIPEANPSSPA